MGFNFLGARPCPAGALAYDLVTDRTSCATLLAIVARLSLLLRGFAWFP